MKSATLTMAVLLLATSVTGAPLQAKDVKADVTSSRLQTRGLNAAEVTFIAAGMTGFITAPIAGVAAAIGSKATAISTGVIDKQVANKAVQDAKARDAAAFAAAQAAQQAKQNEAKRTQLLMDLLKTWQRQGTQQARGDVRGHAQGMDAASMLQIQSMLGIKGGKRVED